MRRRSKNIISAPLEVKEHESRYTEEKEEASRPHLSKDQKICKVIKSRGLRAAKKENLSDGNEGPMQKCTRSLEKESYCHREDIDSCQFAECPLETLKGDVAGEHPLPLNSKENVPQSRAVSLGGECYLTPKRDKAEEKADPGISEKQQKTPIDFTTVTIAEFGITQESFTKGSVGKSPMSLKYRRRSAIGVRGSPENNTLIQFLAQQRRIRQKEAFTEINPFKHHHVRSLKDKIDAFQMSFKSVQEAEGEIGQPGLSQVDDTSQEAGSSRNTVSLTKERNLDQWSEKFTSDNSGAGLEENLSWNLTDSSKSDTKICTIFSSCQDVSVTEPAAALSEECIHEQHNPTELSEAVLIRDVLETEHDFSSDHITKDLRSDLLSDVNRKKVSFVEEPSLEIFDERKPPVTPVRMGDTPLRECGQSGSRLRSVLKKTPVKPLLDNTKKYWNDAADRGEGESLAVSSCAEISEAWQTEKTESYSSEKAKKRVTFGEVLSPEIFDETLPANTPLCKGATPARQPAVQGHSPSAGPQLSEEPLPQPNFDSDEECVEPLQELVEGPVAAGALLPVGNTEATTDTPDTLRTCSTKKKCSPLPEGTDFSISRATNTTSAEDVEKPRKNKFQIKKNITSAVKKTQKKKHTGYGKRRKKKVKKSLYGEREMASKKPLLSPIPEIPEVFSFVSSPDSPEANTLLSDDTRFGNSQKDVQQNPVVEKRRRKNTSRVRMDGSSEDLDTIETSSSHAMVLQASNGDVESVSGIGHKFSDTVPDAKCGSDPSDCFQEGEKTACVKESEAPGSLLENKKLQENPLNKAEQLTGIKFLEQEDTHVHEGAQRTWCPQEDSVRCSPSRRRGRSGAIYFPPVEKLKIPGNDLPVSFNIEEVLSVPQLKNDSFEPFRRKSGNSGEKRVRRSMRLHKDAENEGLAWVQVPDEIQKRPPLLGSARRIRRTISTSILTASENIHPSEQNLTSFSALGKENSDSVHLADGPCKRWRRKSVCVSTPQETRAWSQTRKRSITKSVYRKDRGKEKHYEDVEIPLENNI